MGKPRVLLTLQLQPDLIGLQLVRVPGGLVHKDPALLPTHSSLQIALALRDLIARVVLAVIGEVQNSCRRK